MSSGAMSTSSAKYPLLSGKPFSEYSPEAFRDYVRSLYVAPPVPAPKAEYSASVTKKGSVTFRINREPKFLLASEIRVIAEDIGKSLQETWMLVLKRKTIEIRRG